MGRKFGKVCKRTIDTMKKILTILAVLLFVTSCGKKNNSENTDTNTTTDATEFHVADVKFDNNWNMPFDITKNLDKQTYDSLKLGKLSFMSEYGTLDYQIGDILFNVGNKKLLSVKAIASGEIAEYLLGYVNDNITDSLLVAYEDNVEYYSTTYSTVRDNTIITTTIDLNNEGTKEISDTTIVRYHITPEMTFEEVFEE